MVTGSRPNQYDEKETLGPHGIKYLREAIRRKKRRRAVFACPFCNSAFERAIEDVKSGKVKNCGCLRRTRNGKTSQNGEKHPVCSLWIRIVDRCYNPKNIGYEYYGARGIKVCPQWKEDYEAFYDWAIENGWEKGLQIDRINNNGDYSHENCRFVSPKINSNNRRSTRYVIAHNTKMTFSECIERHPQVSAGKLFNWSRGYGLKTKPEWLEIVPKKRAGRG